MGYGHWTYERLMGVLNGQKEYKLSRVLTVTRAAASAIIHYGNHRLIEYHKDGRIRIHSIGEKRNWGGSCAKVNEVLGYGYRVYHHHDRSKSVKSRWVFMVCKGEDWKSYPRYEFPTYDPLTINPDGTITVEDKPAVQFDRDAEMAKAKAERTEKRAKVNQLRLEVTRKCRQLKLRQEKIQVPVGNNEQIWIQAWISGHLAIHPVVRHKCACWEEGVAISHSGLQVMSADTSAEVLKRFRRIKRLEGKISLYLTFKKMGVDTQTIFAEIREKLYAA